VAMNGGMTQRSVELHATCKGCDCQHDTSGSALNPKFVVTGPLNENAAIAFNALEIGPEWIYVGETKDEGRLYVAPLGTAAPEVTVDRSDRT
jgi:hypothetical protein